MKKLVLISFFAIISIVFADQMISNNIPGYAYLILKKEITTCKINAKNGDLYNCNSKNGSYTSIDNVSINKVIQNGLNRKITNYFARIKTINRQLSCIINPYTGMISYLNCHTINLFDGIDLSNNTFNKYNYQVESPNSIAICTNDSHTCHHDHRFKDIQNILIIAIPKPIDHG